MANSGVGGSLSAASDVNLNNPASGEVLKRSGASWSNAALVKADIGLGNVNNTSDMDKPVSTAQADAIASAGGGGPVTTANLPSGSVLHARFNADTSIWPARPTARADIMVHWIGSDGSTAPPGAVSGVDIWDWVQ